MNNSKREEIIEQKRLMREAFKIEKEYAKLLEKKVMEEIEERRSGVEYCTSEYKISRVELLRNHIPKTERFYRIA
ncbi:MAG: hypothetical protein V1921_03165 [Candidatus Altiarchaeota archaeon]